MNANAVKMLFVNLAERFEEEKERLGDLDSILGDGDHGLSMANGFSKANEAIKNSSEADVGKLFQQAGRALMSAIGGASGPLFAMVLLELAKASLGEESLSAAAFQEGISNAAAAVQRLGKAQQGDKTMLDVLMPVSEALKATNSLKETLELAFETATKAAVGTSELAAKKGRAQYVQGGGIGHPDPGCVSLALVFEVFLNTYQEVLV